MDTKMLSNQIIKTAKTCECTIRTTRIYCSNGHTDIVKLLLNKAAIKNIILNARDENGDTAFVKVCQRAHMDVIKLLLYYSDRITINLNAKNRTLGKKWHLGQ